MSSWVVSVSLFALLALPAYAVDITLTVSTNAQGQTTVASAAVPHGSTTVLPQRLHSVRLTCNGVPCAGITVAVDTTEICSVGAGETSCDGTIRPGDFASPATLVVRRDTTPIYSATIQPAVASGQPQSAAGTGVELADLLKTPCETAIAAALQDVDLEGATDPSESSTYSRSQNRAVFIVDVLGNVLAAPTENVDENDTVVVRVIADNRLHRFLRVRRKSAIRTLTNRLLGSGLKVPIAQLAQGLPVPGACEPKDFVLKDFNPGKGEVEIQAQVGTQTQSLGTFEFIVDPLYNGMFSLGTATSNLTDRSFKLRTVDEDKFIYATEEGDTTQYVVYFTPFLRARDIEKSGQPFWEHINPTFGISTQNTGSNAYAGVSIDYKGFVVSGGWHFSRINALATSSGLEEGDVFAGAEADIPQAERWENDKFIGVSIDLRSAVELFQTLVSGAGGGS